MTDRRKNILMLATLLGIMILFFAKILFTHKIIRAPDIINEYYWTVLNISGLPFADVFHLNLTANWDIYSNSGNTLEGGGLGSQFLVWQKLLYHFIQPPASVAWFIVLHYFIGAAGVYAYCRTIGTSCVAALLGGIIFAFAPEMVSLINAGHVLKIATISIAPWAFFMLERGLLTRRVTWFMATGFVLALQFFYTHWQIAYYTCLCAGTYGICSYIGIVIQEREKQAAARLFALNLVVLFFFLSTVAIDLFPLANWSTNTNRGAQSGANQGKGGLEREEAMSWSMPPEELGTFVIPGFFGFSRQEGGENPTNIRSYYWGRMVFTQTTSYIGLLPWLLMPLPLIFRRDRYTLLATLAIVGGIVFSMGKYTPVYNFLFDYFPGINRFRVPKMMMFIPVIGLGVMAARGLDLLRDDLVRSSATFRRYLAGIAALPIILLLLLVMLKFGKSHWLSLLSEMITQPTRYEQGAYLLEQRWGNIISETGIATGLSALYAAAILTSGRGLLPSRLVPLALMAILLLDVGRVNAKFMLLTDVPTRSTGMKTPTVEFLLRQSNQYRVLPLSQDPAYFASHRIPVLFTPMPVQQVRWQEILNSFNLNSVVPDMLNIRYLVISSDAYRQEQQQFGGRYVPVFTSPDGSEIVLENRNVLSKAWLVSSVLAVENQQQTLQLLQNPAFNPRQIAMVESPPPLQLGTYGQQTSSPPGKVIVNRYEGERIELSVKSAVNSLLVIGEKYYKGWQATVDGKSTEIIPVNHILRGVYLTPGNHHVEFKFDPLPFKIGKYLTLGSFALFAVMLVREWQLRRRGVGSEG